jgi:glucosamine-6-phosphate deaminase
MKKTPPPRRAAAGKLDVEIHRSRGAMGLAAARACAAYLRDVIAARGEARVIFACAPSQDEFLAALVNRRRTQVAVDWSKVIAFHMDEYVGLPAAAPQRFQHYLRKHLLDHVEVGRFHGLSATESNWASACARYAALLHEKPIDLICLGIGENGHIAFNDPPVAKFDDAKLVKRVTLDRVCRQQQVNDGCFPTLGDVPRRAVTLTLPVFRQARRLSVVVPGMRKAAAVRATLHDPIATACPATILRRHANATLYLDTESAALAFGEKEARSG